MLSYNQKMYLFNYYNPYNHIIICVNILRPEELYKINRYFKYI